MSTKHKLVAILSTDAAGYSKLMADDDAPFARSMKHAIFSAKRVEARGGKIDTAGNSILAEIPSAVEEVDCVVEISANSAGAIADSPSTSACSSASPSISVM